MTSDREALFAAILSAPDDDLPRLVFADWQEETGHPANAAPAAYIRLQVEAERHPLGSSVRLELTRQAEELRPSFRDEWDQAVDAVAVSGVSTTRRRGFVDEVAVTVEPIQRMAEWMFSAAPVRVLRVAAADGSRHWRGWGFLLQPLMFRVRVLQLGPRLADLLPTYVTRDGGEWVDGSAFDLLLDNPNLSGISRLELLGNDLDDAWIVRFVSLFPTAAFAGVLSELDLSNNQVTDAGANTLAAGRGLDRLDRLVLTGNRITPAGAELLRRRFGGRVEV